MEPFKNHFSYSNVRRIAECVKRAHPPFSVPRFCRGLEAALEPLELKQRMHLVADRLEAGLPTHPPELFAILAKTLAKDADVPHGDAHDAHGDSCGDSRGDSRGDSCGDSCGLHGFPVWPLSEIVARRGLEHFDESMSLFSEITKCFTAEFAIRPFLRVHRERTLKQLQAWCRDPDEHVRRLVSEGSRPLLPWGGNLPELLEPPHPTLGLLESLHRDPSDYVRLSVSNHLNDFSKHYPELVIQTLTRWLKNAPDDVRVGKLARHACRTLLKAGHPGALALHGYGSAKSMELEVCELTQTTVKLGGSLGYRLVVHNRTRGPLKVMFDYAIHYRKANGTLSPKVFKGRIRELAAAERWEITGQHSLKPVTTRVYHSGLHGFAPQLNGQTFPPMDFMLVI